MYNLKQVFAGERPEVKVLGSLIVDGPQNASLDLEDHTGKVSVSAGGGLSLEPAHGHWGVDIAPDGGSVHFDTLGNQPGPSNNIQIDGLPEEIPGYRGPTATDAVTSHLDNYRKQNPYWYQS